jgi:hypothetical protein
MMMDPMSLTIGFVLAWIIVFPLTEWRARRRRGTPDDRGRQRLARQENGRDDRREAAGSPDADEGV